MGDFGNALQIISEKIAASFVVELARVVRCRFRTALFRQAYLLNFKKMRKLANSQNLTAGASSTSEHRLLLTSAPCIS